MKFSASLNTTSRVISGLILAFPLPLFLFKQEIIWVSVLLEALFFICYGIAPQYYVLTDSELKIKRLFRSVHIPLAEIKTVSAIAEPKTMAAQSLREFGSGGLFGYFGKFWNPHLKQMTWYVTNFRNLILIETKAGKKILLSPDDPEMLAFLQKKVLAIQPQTV